MSLLSALIQRTRPEYLKKGSSNTRSRRPWRRRVKSDGAKYGGISNLLDAEDSPVFLVPSYRSIGHVNPEQASRSKSPPSASSSPTIKFEAKIKTQNLVSHVKPTPPETLNISDIPVKTIKTEPDLTFYELRSITLQDNCTSVDADNLY